MNGLYSLYWLLALRGELNVVYEILGQEAVAHLEEIKKSIEAKIALRQSNLNPDRPG